MANDRHPKPLSQYLAMIKPKKPQTGQDILAIFKGFQAAGVPVNITKLN